MESHFTRWRLILGQDAPAMEGVALDEQQSLRDATLGALYDHTDGKGGMAGGRRSAGWGTQPLTWLNG